MPLLLSNDWLEVMMVLKSFFIVQVMYFQEVEPLGEESSGVVKHPR